MQPLALVVEVALAPHLEGHLHGQPLGCRHGCNLLLDSDIHLLPEPRHGRHASGPHLLDGVLDHLGVAVHCHLGAAVQAHIGEPFLEDVAQGQECHRHIVGAYHVKAYAVTYDGGVIVGMGEDSPLGLAGGARGVDQCGDVLGRSLGCPALYDGLGLPAGLLAELDEVVPRHRGGVVGVELHGLDRHYAGEHAGHLLHLAGVVILCLVARKEQ